LIIHNSDKNPQLKKQILKAKILLYRENFLNNLIDKHQLSKKSLVMAIVLQHQYQYVKNSLKIFYKN